MDDGTLKQLEAQCDGIVAALEFIAEHEGEEWDDIDPEERKGFDPDDICPDREPLSLYDWCVNALDVEVYGKRLDGDWVVTHIEVLFTCGGPDVRFTTEHGAHVVGHWGSDVVRRYVGGDVGARLDEMLGEI